MDQKPSYASAQSPTPDWKNKLQAMWRDVARVLRRYADWLAEQSWKRLALLGVVAVAAAGILSGIPPFSTPWGADRTIVHPPKHAKHPAHPAHPASSGSVELQIDANGVRVVPRAPAPPAPPGAASVPQPPTIELPPGVTPPNIDIKLPPNAGSEEVRQAIEEARNEIKAAIEEAQSEAEEDGGRTEIIRAPTLGEHLVPLMMVIIAASIIAKVMGAGRKKAEAQAAVATERADSESLRRQVIEARMAAMQAQVEPHFLFNTLASIDHLIETDPARASQMQKNLIALLRASMPTMREANASGLRELGREISVIRPYLEILKVRMEERLQYEIDVPDGLLSAEFPPMMVQGLVENAIKHGLEPKAEGGRLSVKADIRHGKLCITVADTGLGFGKAATAGTGVGLANIRERLQMLYGPKGTLTVTENTPSGTVVSITVPYTHRHSEGA